MWRRKKQENIPKEYWKKKGFDSDKEFVIYQNLCGNLKAKKKIEKEKQFYKYMSWREYVEEKIEKYDEETLTEFYHFIKLKRRQCDIDTGMHISIFIPLVVAVISNGIVQCVIETMINLYSPENASGNYDLNVLGLILGIAAMSVLMFILGLSMYFLLRDVMDPYVKSKNETSFWEDCLEIVKNKIEKEKNGI